MDEQRDTQPSHSRIETARLVLRAFGEWLSRPRVRLAVIGVILLLVGGLQMTSSVWTLPLVLIGAVMVAIAWIGRRLEGSFSVEWGQSGTQLGFRARVNPAHDEPPALPAPPPVQTTSPVLADGDVIEGEAHTVEIDVAELKALIAAAETRGTGHEPPEATAEAIRIVRRAADRS
jgi:hypothetical protein